MNINKLIAIIKNKLETKVLIENIKIEDKSFLHKKHKSHQEGKFHIKLSIKSISFTILCEKKTNSLSMKDEVTWFS